MVSPRDAAKTIHARNQLELRAVAERRADARDEGLRLALKIVNEHPEAARVWGFGSTYEAWRRYRLDSDIDLATEGGSAYELLKIVERSAFKVDVISFEEIPAGLADLIREHGTLLAEAPDGR